MTLEDLVTKDMNRFQKMRFFAERKVKRKFWGEHNKLIDDALQERANKGLPITSHAHEKLHVTVDAYKSLLEQAGLPSQEFSFYLTGTKGDDIVDDVYVIRDQVVTPIRTTTDDRQRSAKTEGISSLRDIKLQGKTIKAHGHSHGDMKAFFSSTDHESFYRFNQDRGMKQQLSVTHEDHDHDYSIKPFPALVINHDHDIDLRVKTKRPLYAVDEQGQVTKNETYQDHDLEFNIIGAPVTLSQEEKKNIDDDLRKRVTIDMKRQTLDQLLGTTKEFVHQPEEQDAIVESLKNRYKEKQHVTEPEEVPLTRKTIDAKVEQPAKNYEQLKQQYDQLLQENRLLKQKNAYLSSRPLTMSYTKNMLSYERHLKKQEARPEQLLGTMVKLLSGQYKGSLDEVLQGNYQEDKNETRIWKWEDRIKAVMRLYEDNRETINTVNTGYLDSLKETLHKNYYFRKHHEEKKDDLDRLFLNIKRTTLSAPQACDQTRYTASTADALAS